MCFTVKAQPRAFAAYTGGVIVNASRGAQTLNYLNPGGQVPGWMLDAVTALYSSPFEKQLGFGGLYAC